MMNNVLTTTTRPPYYYHFRFNEVRKSLLHHHPSHIRCFSASNNNSNGNANIVVTQQQPTNYSGWSVEKNATPDPVKPKLGVVGARLAGVVLLLTGLAFVVFSITKSGSVSKWKMTTQQQETLSSAEETDTIEEYDGSKDDNTILEGTTVSPAPQVLPGKVIVPAVVDQVHAQTLAALQVLKVIEGNVQPGDICTRREYARWLVSASSSLSRSIMSKVYPAMYIQNVTELAFDDITPEDPDFSSIQGLAEAGLIGSKLSRYDMNPSDQDETLLNFCPESPLSRKDLVSWKMSLEKRVLPVADRMILQQCSGFIDIDKIHPDAWPALVADLSAGEQGIVSLAFGYTRLFQPDKPVTKAQAAVALASGEASDVVSEELARIEAESVAEKAVAAHTALVEQVEKDLNAKFEKDLLLEMEKITTVEKMAEDVKQELESLKAEREKENIKLMEERAAVDSEMEVFSKLRREVEEQLSSFMSNKLDILHEKERLSKLLTDVEIETEEISKLQLELEIERKALSMARSWAEDEAKRTREQAKVLDEARDHWKSQGIKIVVDQDLHEDANAGATWLGAGDKLSVEGTKSRAQNLVDKLRPLTTDLKGKSKEIIEMVIQKVLGFISQLKEWTSKAEKQVEEVKVKLTHKFKT